MMSPEQRIDALVQALEQWFSDKVDLEKSIDDTLKEGVFTRHDINYSLAWARECVNREVLAEWWQRTGAGPDSQADSTVLCLHAGNLPIVGLQDILAVLLSGGNYLGKISKKDPYLLAGLLEKLRDCGFSDKIHYSTELETFQGFKADAVMFSGSGESARQVKKLLHEKDIASETSRKLIRTASFSMAYVSRTDESTLRELAEAILRYEGKGCRSVAMVISPNEPTSMIKNLGDFMEEFWAANPPLKELSPKTRYRYAYNKAIGRMQHLFRHILIEQNEPDLDNDDVIYWIRGDLFTAGKLAQANLIKLQNIYTENPKATVKGFEDRIQSIASAQHPPIDWEPDGVDPLQWLVGEPHD